MILGTSKLSLAELLPFTNLTDFLDSCHDNENTYEHDSVCGVISSRDLSPFIEKPSIEFRFMLTYVSTNKLATQDLFESRIREKEVKTPEIDIIAGGDRIEHETLQTPTPLKLEHMGDDKGIVISPKISKNEEEPPGAPSTNNELLNTEKPKLDTIPRTFSYNLILQNIKFTNHVENGIWQVSFYHPRADTPFTIVNLELQNIEDEFVDFNNLELPLYFSAMPDEISDVITADNCLFNISGPRGTRGKAELDSQSLLVGNKEKKSGIILLENQNGEKMAMANIFVSLEDLGINHNSQIKKSVPPLIEDGPTAKSYVDEGLAYRFVEDLEKWKKAQEEDFLVEVSFDTILLYFFYEICVKIIKMFVCFLENNRKFNSTEDLTESLNLKKSN